MVKGSHVTPYLWDGEERRREVTADEYTVVGVDGFPTIGKNMTEKMASLQAALNVVGHAGRDMSNSVQHF
jgi:hypothetical protein